MYRNKRDKVEKEEREMDVTMDQDRPCSISESIKQSCIEVKSMREGKMPKRSLNELFTNIEKWSKEEE